MSGNQTRGGYRPGSGRKKGSRTLRTQEVAKRLMNEGETPLEYMLRVMRTSDDTKRKDAMAMAAAPYLHPKLAAVEHSGDADKPVVMEHIGHDANAFTSRITRLNAGASEDEGAGEPN